MYKTVYHFLRHFFGKHDVNPSQIFDLIENFRISSNLLDLEQKMSASEQKKLKWEESETVRNLLKKQNSLLGDSLEALDPFTKKYQPPKF